MANAFDIGLLMRFLPFLYQAKGHFSQASREALLGIDKIVDLMLEQVADPKTGPLQNLQPIANNVKSFIDLLLKELPDKNNKNFHEMKLAVLDSILDVIRQEIVYTQAMTESGKKSHKLEALKAIEKVLLKERMTTTPPSEDQEETEEETSTARTSSKVTRIRNVQGRPL